MKPSLLRHVEAAHAVVVQQNQLNRDFLIRLSLVWRRKRLHFIGHKLGFHEADSNGSYNDFPQQSSSKVVETQNLVPL